MNLKKLSDPLSFFNDTVPIFWGRSIFHALAIAFSTIIAGCLAVSAQTVPDNAFTDLGALPDKDPLPQDSSTAYGVSPDGKIIVGVSYADTARGSVHAVKWVNGASLPFALDSLGGKNSAAGNVSADGAVIVGMSSTMGNGGEHAVKWVNGESIPTDLGTLGGTDSFAIAVNGDGSVIVGFSKMTGDKAEHAVEWRDGATSPTDLGALGGTKSSAVDVSAAGAVIVGESETPSEIGVSSHAVKWANGAKVPTDLGILRSINPLVNLVASSHASAVSADGSVIVGYASFSDEDPGWLIVNRAVSWADGATNPTDLGTLGGRSSIASDVNADGNVIVGEAQRPDRKTHAVKWVDGSTVPIDLGTLGGSSSRASAVSADGKIIVGESETPGDLTTVPVYWYGDFGPIEIRTWGGKYGAAYRVSADGTQVIGEADLAGCLSRHAFSFQIRRPPGVFDEIPLSLPLAKPCP